jgi:3-hydroxyisobutyrate dehydrogenase
VAPPEEIGFVGLGNMGMPMARRLPAAGYQVVGYDASADVMREIAGLDGFSAAPGITGLGTDVVMLSLPDSDVVEHVLLDEGLLDSVSEGGMVIDMSSSDPARTRALAARADDAGVTLIDAPVSGGVSGARAGTLTIMVGGPPEAFDLAQPMLAAIGQRVVHAGDVGAGHAVKALNNLMSAAHLAVSSEALIAGRRFGLDPAVMLDIINGSSGRSGSTENKWPNYVLTEKYDAGFSIRLMVKDMKLALGIEHATGTPSSVSEAVLAAWEAALAELPADADHTAIARWLDRLGGQIELGGEFLRGGLAAQDLEHPALPQGELVEVSGFGCRDRGADVQGFGFQDRGDVELALQGPHDCRRAVGVRGEPEQETDAGGHRVVAARVLPGEVGTERRVEIRDEQGLVPVLRLLRRSHDTSPSPDG